MNYLLGVDGGSTKTIALVARTDGTIVGAGRGGSSNIYDPRGADLAGVDEALDAAFRAAGLRADQIASAAFSMAGGDWPEDLAYLHSEMAGRGLSGAITVANDAMGALRAGSPDGTGVVVVCGTGTATGARNVDGRTWHSGFWQEQAGAQDLGERALRAIVRAELGIGPATSLTPRVLDLCGLASVEALLHAFTAREVHPLLSLTRLAPLLLDEAERGDAVALSIVQERAAVTGDYALAAARQVELDDVGFRLVLAGGLLRHPSRLFRDGIIARVRAEAPLVRPVCSRFEPAVGALFLAFDAAGLPVDDSTRQRLESSLPADVFAVA